MEISNLAYVNQAFRNDLQYLYSHTYGLGFEKIQSLTKGLMDEIDVEQREFISLALQNGEDIDNPSNIKSHLDMDSEWNPTTEWQDISKAFQEIDNKIIVYMNALNISGLPQPMKEQLMSFWKSFLLNISRENMIVGNFPKMRD